MPTLIVEKGPDRGKSLELVKGSRFVFGRDAVCDFVMADPSCSRRHFEVFERGGEFFVKDLGSTHGTQANGWRISESRLHDGDSISAGESVFSFSAESTPARGMVGKVVGGYQVIDRLGRGGMGTVYKAKQIALDREVALKVLAAKYSDNKTFINRFFKEAQAAARLNHPNIVQVYDVREEQGLYLISLELMSKGTVQDLATEQGQLPISRVLEIARDAAKGLMYAEQKGIVHGDIKPDNLMINADGHIKISDLGLARPVGEVMSAGDEGIFGTPHFISPEQALGKPVDSRSDIYSFGATLYRLIAGSTPFQGSSVTEIVKKQINDSPDEVKSRRADCPQDLADLVAVCMAKDPAERFASAKDLHDAVMALGTSGELTRPAPKGIRAAAAILLVLVVGAVSAYFLMRSKPEDNGSKPPPAQPGPNVDSRPVAGPDQEALTRFEKDRQELAVAQLHIDAKRFLDSLTHDGKRDDIDSLKEARQKFIAAHDLHPETDNAALALQDAEALAARIRELEDNAAATAREEAEARARVDADFEKLKNEWTQAINNMAFAEAIHLASTGLENLKGTHREAEVIAFEVDAVAGAKTAAANLQKEAGLYLERNEFARAREELAKISGRFNPAGRSGDNFSAIADLVQAAETRITELTRLEGEKLISDRKLDQQLAFEVLHRYFVDMRTGWCVNRVKPLLDTACNSVATTETKDFLNTHRERLNRILGLQEKLITKALPEATPEIRVTGIKGVPSGRIVGADQQNITIEKSAGATQSVPWGDFEPRMLYRQVLRRIVETPGERLDLIAYLLDAGLPDDALKELEDLKKSNPEALETEMNRLASEAVQESEAEKKMEEIRTLHVIPNKTPQTWFDLKSLAEVMATNYRQTRSFLVHSDGSTAIIQY